MVLEELVPGLSQGPEGGFCSFWHQPLQLSQESMRPEHQTAIRSIPRWEHMSMLRDEFFVLARGQYILRANPE